MILFVLLMILGAIILVIYSFAPFTGSSKEKGQIGVISSTNDEEVAELKRQIGPLKAKMEKAESDCFALQKELREAHEVKSDELADVVSAKDAQISQLKEHIDSLQVKTKSAELEQSRLQAEFNSLNEKLKSAKSQYTNLHGKLQGSETSETDLKVKEQQIYQLEQQVRTLTVKLEKTDVAYTQLQKEFSRSEEELQGVKGGKEEDTKQVSQLQGQIRLLDKELKSTNFESEQLKEEVQQLRSIRDAKDGKGMPMVSVAKNQEISEMKAYIKSLSDKLKEADFERIQLKDELKEAKSKGKLQEGKTTKGARKGVPDLSEQLAKLKLELDILRAENETLKDGFIGGKEATPTAEELNKKLKEKDEKFQLLDEKNKKMTDEIKTLTEKIKQLQKKQGEDDKKG